ncbi:hypothetical protein RHGRI_013156 [Rhododendron griersonianum]|uniref:Uncharacterized protein n=1 Tax=Rhododendron griersonianum TaxID=479676 RepID=A0AAV6K4H8_9ERIC|nr:hypothetical protein RHGRI_013156 [Rhododendron griersonianum]
MKETVQKYIKVVKEGYKRVTQKLGIEFSFSWKAPVLKKRNVLLYVMHGFLVLSWIVQPCKRKEAGAVEKLKDDHAAEGKPAEGGASEADAPGGEIEGRAYGIDASSTEMSSFAKELKEFVLGGYREIHSQALLFFANALLLSGNSLHACIVVVLVRDESNNFRRFNRAWKMTCMMQEYYFFFFHILYGNFRVENVLSTRLDLEPRIIRVFDYVKDASGNGAGDKAPVKSKEGHELPPPQPQVSEFPG